VGKNTKGMMLNFIKRVFYLLAGCRMLVKLGHYLNHFTEKKPVNTL